VRPNPNFRLASHFEQSHAVTKFDELDDHTVLETHEVGEVDQTATSRAAMAPLDFAASGDATLLDENFGNLTLGLLKINRHSADDVDEGVDPEILTSIGNPRGGADKIANNVGRTKVEDHVDFGTVRWEGDKLTSASFDFVTIKARRLLRQQVPIA
jgi:hypothetical protein